MSTGKSVAVVGGAAVVIYLLCTRTRRGREVVQAAKAFIAKPCCAACASASAPAPAPAPSNYLPAPVPSYLASAPVPYYATIGLPDVAARTPYIPPPVYRESPPVYVAAPVLVSGPVVSEKDPCRLGGCESSSPLPPLPVTGADRTAAAPADKALEDKRAADAATPPPDIRTPLVPSGMRILDQIGKLIGISEPTRAVAPSILSVAPPAKGAGEYLSMTEASTGSR